MKSLDATTTSKPNFQRRSGSSRIKNSILSNCVMSNDYHILISMQLNFGYDTYVQSVHIVKCITICFFRTIWYTFSRSVENV